MINYRAAMERHGIQPRGVIHVGGHIGTENESYRAMGFEKRVFIEANPDVYRILVDNVGASGAVCINRAISNTSGTIDFYVTSFDQSSSILPIKKHADLYPDITEVKNIKVSASRLDECLVEHGLFASEYNFLNMDIQGAEFLALSGASSILPNMDMINLEVNFDELYAGAPHISKLDSFLSAFDFIRVDTVLAHFSWGDAIYVQNRFTKIAPR